MPYQAGFMRPGPPQGTPPAPQAPNSTGQTGGRPPGTGGAPSLQQTMQGWRANPGNMGQPPSAGTGGAQRPPVAPLPGAPAPPSLAGTRPTQPSSQGFNKAGPVSPQMPGQPGLVPGTGMPGATVLPSVPRPDEVANLPPGSYETPMGTLVKGPDGTSKVVLNQQGQQAWQQRVAEAMKAFGNHPWANDPQAPQPPVKPGSLAWNPFTGQWSGPGMTPQR